MYRPKKDNTLPPLRMDPLSRMPDVEHLTEALDQARNNEGRLVELTWPKPGHNLQLLLTVIFIAGGGDPLWTFGEREIRQPINELWRYASGDPTLIYNLVLAECTGEVVANDDGSQQVVLDASKFTSNTTSSYSTSLLGMQATSGTRYPVVNTSKSTRDATMEGQLEDMSIPNLLQSIVMAKMTGRLFVDAGNAASELFFEDGVLLHASALDVAGDQALMELVTWEKGKFYFYRDEKTIQRTIGRRLDAILMEGITLLDQSKFLMEQGLKMESYLDKKYPNLSESEFDGRVSAGAPVPAELQKQFYIALDGCTSLFDLLRRKPMVKKDWVAIIFNLVQCDLITIAKKPSKIDKTSFLESSLIDKAAIERVRTLLARPETGIVSYPNFHFFLDQEFTRYQLYKVPCSLIVFELRMLLPNSLEPLSIPAMKEAASRIRGMLSPLDVFAHFETISYAILLPNTEPASAAMLAHRILENLRGPLLPGVDNLAMAFGVAGIPEDCRDMGLLVSAAKASKLVAQRNNYPIVMFKDMQAPNA